MEKHVKFVLNDLKATARASVLVIMYKVYNNLAPGYLTELFQMRECRLDSTLSNLRSVANKNYVLPQAKCNLFKGSLSFSGVVIWNSIPLEIKQSSSLNILAKDALSGSKASYILTTCLHRQSTHFFFSYYYTSHIFSFAHHIRSITLLNIYCIK